MKNRLLPGVFKAGKQGPDIEKDKNPEQNQGIRNPPKQETQDILSLKSDTKETMIQ